MYNSIKPGKIWLDTNGNPIQAHGLSVFYKDGIYYWYGENKEKTKGGSRGTIWHWGVRCYTSKDLYNWEDKGLIIPPEPGNLQSPLHPTYQMDRPHIMYCKKTGKYVAWLKIMAGEISQFMTVIQADNFFGPYEYVRKIYNPLKMNAGDFTLVDSGDKAYIIFERPHFELITATLTDDYTAVTGEYSAHYQGLNPPHTREAPSYFTRNGKHYLFTSGTSGYFPNKTQVCEFTDFHGEYKDIGDPCLNDKTLTTFNSQISGVLKIPSKNLWIAYADRWQPGKKSAFFSKMITSGMEKLFKDYVPDTAPQEVTGLSGKMIKHTENTSKSTYVWLPIEWQGDKPVILWRDEWRIEEF
jgi:hypothetical protein